MSTPEASAAPYQHRVVSGKPTPRLCTCGVAPVVRYDGDRSPGWSVSCPNRATKAEVRYNRDGKCENTRLRWRTTKDGAISAWNVAMNPTPRRNYIAAEDSAKPRTFCRCGLSLPCNDCLEGTAGFQRKQSHGDASARVRMGG